MNNEIIEVDCTDKVSEPEVSEPDLLEAEMVDEEVYSPFEKAVIDYFQEFPDACVNDCIHHVRENFHWKGGFNAVANEILRIKQALEE